MTVRVRNTQGNVVALMTTLGAGAYQVRLPAGTYTVEGYGPGLAGIVTHSNVVIGAQNVKRDFNPVKPAATWEQVGTGDFNNDNHADILWHNRATGTIGAWLMVNGAYTSYRGIGAVPYAEWEIGGVGDFNNDGHDDILWRNKNTGTVGAWRLVNGAFNSWVSIGSVPYSDWEIGGVGDFNNNGHDDILWRNKTTGRLGAWLLVNGVLNSWQLIGTVSYTDWEIGGVGDINHNGHVDILWRQRATGALGAWLLINGVYNSWSGTIGTVSSATWTAPGINDFNNNNHNDVLWHDFNGGTFGGWLLLNGFFNSWLKMGAIL